ncbi:MAG TPA: glycosyltransferase family A protein [Stellaceae bacterium]|nr:glycosyltransferase family A protein [Stellaceae bacterium]
MEDRIVPISVIVCNYNYERFVGEAIDSVLQQTYPHVELIVVDDGSTDGSRDVIAGYPGIVSVFKENGGQSSGIRAGLARVTGEIVIVLDSDDLLLPSACAVIAENWDPSLSLLQFTLEKRNGEGRVIGRYPDQPFLHGGEREFVLTHGYLPSSPTSGNAFSRKHIENAFKYNTDRDRNFADGYLIFTAPLYGDVRSLDTVLGIYRVHGENASLSAGVTLPRLRNQFKTNLAHRLGLADHARRLGASPKDALDYLGPYDWRAAMLIKRLMPSAPELAGISRFRILWRGITAFLSTPRLSTGRRLRNIAGLFVTALGPSTVARAMMRG